MSWSQVFCRAEFPGCHRPSTIDARLRRNFFSTPRRSEAQPRKKQRFARTAMVPNDSAVSEDVARRCLSVP
jgi:hypothetical protein